MGFVGNLWAFVGLLCKCPILDWAGYGEFLPKFKQPFLGITWTFAWILGSIIGILRPTDDLRPITGNFVNDYRNFEVILRPRPISAILCIIFGILCLFIRILSVFFSGILAKYPYFKGDISTRIISLLPNPLKCRPFSEDDRLAWARSQNARLIDRRRISFCRRRQGKLGFRL